jgi:hypothetical protein
MKEIITFWTQMEICESKVSTTRYAHIDICLMNRVEDGTIRNLVSKYSDTKIRYFDSLHITCQLDNHDEDPYAFRTTYNDVCQIGIDTAKKMVKSLGSIEKKLHKMQEEYGEPKTFSEYALRVFRAIKADSFCFTVKRPAHGSLSNGEYSFEKDPTEVSLIIEDMINICRKRIR